MALLVVSKTDTVDAVVVSQLDKRCFGAALTFKINLQCTHQY
jgi:hypothetical protein